MKYIPFEMNGSSFCSAYLASPRQADCTLITMPCGSPENGMAHSAVKRLLRCSRHRLTPAMCLPGRAMRKAGNTPHRMQAYALAQDASCCGDTGGRAG